MRIISMLTQKGGTGKSTLCTSLAVAAAEAGETVLVLDCDEQGTTLAWSETRRQRETSQRLSVVALQRLDVLASWLHEAAGQFSVCLLDTPGRDSALTHEVMAASDMVLVPIRPTRADAHGNIATVKACHQANRRFCFLLNQCPTTLTSPRAHEMAAGLKALGVLVPVMVGMRVQYQDAYGLGLGVTEYDPGGKAAEEIRAIWQWVNGETSRDKAPVAA